MFLNSVEKSSGVFEESRLTQMKPLASTWTWIGRRPFFVLSKPFMSSYPGAFASWPLRPYDQPWYLQERILDFPLSSVMIGKARCLQILWNPLICPCLFLTRKNWKPACSNLTHKPGSVNLSLCVVRIHFLAKIARRSSSYTSGDLYQEAGKARAVEVVS